jgi:DUF1680 family protein
MTRLACIALLLVLPSLAQAQDVPTHRLTPVPISQVVVDDEFWAPRMQLWRDVTIVDCFTKFENDRGGALRNFDLVRDGVTGRHAGPEWYDGLIYEMITGASDFLAAHRDLKLEARLDGYIERIVAAQAKDPDGYLNTWTQTMAPQTQRWGMNGGDDRSQHDLYNAGGLIEAGVHHYKATGKLDLLQAGTRIANLMSNTMGWAPKANVVPGHALPEEALVKLFLLYRDNPSLKQRVAVPVDEAKFLELAEFFIDARGHHAGRTGRSASFGSYGQDDVPLAKQQSVEGHAVRSLLFCSGICAAAKENKRSDYLAATQRFWQSFSNHKLYLAGGAGSIGEDEKFGADYDLPNHGYMETCAAVANCFFNANMNDLYGDARYIDEMERALYNATLGGVSTSGTQYFYQNPQTGSSLRRWDWHDCPCCPPMFLKMTGALPGRIYAQEENALYVNLFVGSRATVTLGGKRVAVRQTTRYPWNGAVTISVDPETPAEFDVFVRIPAWANPGEPRSSLYHNRDANGIKRATLSINGKPIDKLDMDRGYARLQRKWQAGDVIEVNFDMPVRQVVADERVEANKGLVALVRGPIVYCAEGVDSPIGPQHLIIPADATFEADFKPELLGGVAVLRGQVKAVQENQELSDVSLTAIPFFAASNREPCQMRVWLPAVAEKAQPATLAARSKATASHCWRLDSAEAMIDGLVPTKSSDNTIGRLSWWDHKGTKEWAELDFPSETEVSSASVFWFADRPVRGGCDVPTSWRLLYKNGAEWVPVKGATEYGVEVDRFNNVSFDPVKTSALRLEVQLQEGWSGGIHEWKVK